MGLLGRFKKSSRPKGQHSPEAAVYESRDKSYFELQRAPPVPLPPKVLKLIFQYVCPHTVDESYETLENSMPLDACALCDAGHLNSCALVCRKWSESAQKILYHSVRLDNVHYCERDYDEIAKKRKRVSFLKRADDPWDENPHQRLECFVRTVRQSDQLAVLIDIVKMPYMIREATPADIARMVSVLPNLRYVDLPEGFYKGDETCKPLRMALQHRCHEIRKIEYWHGSEGSFHELPEKEPWRNLEILSLQNLKSEADALLWVLTFIPTLQELVLHNVSCVDDVVLRGTSKLPPFPVLRTLDLHTMPQVTIRGLCAYASRSDVRTRLTHMRISKTGITPPEIFHILRAAPSLVSLKIHDRITHAFPNTDTIPPLASPSIQELRYEVFPSDPGKGVTNPVESYYAYVAESILSGSLPALQSCYAFSTHLPDLLLLPPAPAFGTFGSARPPSSLYSPINQRFSSRSFAGAGGLSSDAFTAHLSSLGGPLSLYTKSSLAPETEWSLTTIDPPDKKTGKRGSVSETRPLSMLVGRPGSSHAVNNQPLGGLLMVPFSETAMAGRPGSSNGGNGNAGQLGSGWLTKRMPKGGDAWMG